MTVDVFSLHLFESRWAIVYLAQMKPLIVPILNDSEWSVYLSCVMNFKSSWGCCWCTLKKKICSIFQIPCIYVVFQGWICAFHNLKMTFQSGFRFLEDRLLFIATYYTDLHLWIKYFCGWGCLFHSPTFINNNIIHLLIKWSIGSNHLVVISFHITFWGLIILMLLTSRPY